MLNDGRRLGCNRAFNGPTPSVPELLRDGCRKHVALERRGAVTIAWSQAPDGGLRHTVWGWVA
ncbi:MAG: hypothetical protein ACTHMY_11655 [Solirubrobacteraceae bacterium]